LLTATASVRVADLHRELRFRPLASIQLTEAVVNTVAAVALASALGTWALIVGPLAGAAAQSLASYVAAPHTPRLTLDRDAFRSLIGFGRWIFLGGILAVAGGSLVQLAISRQLGAAALGLYFLAGRLGFLLASVSSDLVGAVAFPVYARLQDDPAQGRVAFRTSLITLAAVLVPSTLILIALTPALVENVLGARWDGSAPLIRILAVGGAIGMLGDLIVPVLRGSGRPARAVAMEALQVTILVPAAWLLVGPLGVAGAAAAWIPAVFASQFAGVAFLRKVLPSPFADVARPLLAILTTGMVAASVAWGIDAAWGGVPGLLVAATVGSATALAGLWLSDRRLDIGLGTWVARAFPRIGLALRAAPAEEPAG
jgi:PST family polysaccharide transporter